MATHPSASTAHGATADPWPFDSDSEVCRIPPGMVQLTRSLVGDGRSRSPSLSKLRSLLFLMTGRPGLSLYAALKDDVQGLDRADEEAVSHDIAKVSYVIDIDGYGRYVLQKYAGGTKNGRKFGNTYAKVARQAAEVMHKFIQDHAHSKAEYDPLGFSQAGGLKLEQIFLLALEPTRTGKCQFHCVLGCDAGQLCRRPTVAISPLPYPTSATQSSEPDVFLTPPQRNPTTVPPLGLMPLPMSPILLSQDIINSVLGDVQEMYDGEEYHIPDHGTVSSPSAVGIASEHPASRPEGRPLVYQDSRQVSSDLAGLRAVWPSSSAVASLAPIDLPSSAGGLARAIDFCNLTAAPTDRADANPWRQRFAEVGYSGQEYYATNGLEGISGGVPGIISRLDVFTHATDSQLFMGPTSTTTYSESEGNDSLDVSGLRCDYAPEEGGAELLASTSDEPAAVRDSEHCQPMY